MMAVIRSAFLSFYRSLTRHPLYAGLNLLGLSFGIAVFVTLSLFVRFESSYEQWLPHAGRIYVLTHRTTGMVETKAPVLASSAGYALDAMRGVYPGLVGTRIFPAYSVARQNGRTVEEDGQLVDPAFFAVFDLPVVSGDRQAALRARDGVIVTESTARKYFGRTDVVGENLYLREEHYLGSDSGLERPWRIMAVLKDIPANSELRFSIIRGFDAYRGQGEVPDGWYRWGNSQLAQTFVLLPGKAAADRMVPELRTAILANAADMPPSALATFRQGTQIGLQRFPDWHLSQGHLRQTLSGLAVTAILSLAVALVNYANLATARAGMRAREMATRRVQGATRLSLVGQGMVEAALAGSLSFAVALSLLEVGLPVVNSIGHLSLRLDYIDNALLLLALGTAVLGASLLAGLYPGVLLAGFRPAAVLGMTRTPGGSRWGRRLREGLSVVQFGVTCAFFIVITGFMAQVRHMETSDLGFSRDNLLITGSMPRTSTYADRVERIIAAWRRTPGIAAVANGQIPGVYFRTGFYHVSRALPGAPVVTVDEDFTSPSLFDVYQTPLLAGRAVGPQDDVGQVVPDRTNSLYGGGRTVNINLNLSAAKALGFASPQAAVGEMLRYGNSTLRIVGVVSDQRLQGPTEKTQPMIYAIWTARGAMLDVVIRISGIDESTARQRLAAEWKKVLPEYPLDFTTIRQELDYYYRDDRRNTRLFAVGGGIAGLIGAVGLFGMAAFSTSARVHEIGIRKSSGASRWRIVRLLMFQFLRPVLIANLIAWPVAYVALDGWLKQFDDRIAMSPWFFVAGSGLSLLIAALTVVGVAVSAASLSPAKALRQL